MADCDGSKDMQDVNERNQKSGDITLRLGEIIARIQSLGAGEPSTRKLLGLVVGQLFSETFLPMAVSNTAK